MAVFDNAFDQVMKIEGWYSNNSHDLGKETIAGISRRYHPKWSGWKQVDRAKKIMSTDSLKNNVEFKDNIKSFYKKKFWDKLKADKIWSEKIAKEMFDTAVNMGVSKSVKIVQEACNLTNRNKKADLILDGQIGRKTIHAINSHEDHRTLLKTINSLQAEHYIKICRKNKSQRVFFNGWLRQRIEL